MRSFDQIYVLDLHGSSKKKDVAPDGSKDQNVFDIEQGVAISVFIKRSGLKREIWRGDLWGKRVEKYAAAANGNIADTRWAMVTPSAPFYLFAFQDVGVGREYESGWRLSEVYPLNILGFQTHRDAFAISFTKPEMLKKLADLKNSAIHDEDLAHRYGLKDVSGWSLGKVREAARGGSGTPPQPVAYRPFDDRWSELSRLTMDRPRRELNEHVSGQGNPCLLVPRQIGISQWRHVLITTLPAESCVISNDTKSQNYVMPLLTHGENGSTSENLSPAFRNFIDVHYDGHHFEAEEILGYIYAILHAPTYRRRYAEFLRIDFPRIPFADERKDFEELSKLGTELIEAHLLKDFPRRGLADYHGRGDNSVEKPRYVEAEERIFINDAQFFAPVPKEVWEFHIGGYQVLDKYLKSRKGRTLSLDEINHFAAVADVLAFTIEQMEKIDDAWRKAFPDRG